MIILLGKVLCGLLAAMMKVVWVALWRRKRNVSFLAK